MYDRTSNSRARFFSVLIAPLRITPLLLCFTFGVSSAHSQLTALEPAGESSTETEPVAAIEPNGSDAQRIAELQESLEHDKKQLQILEAEFDSPNSEYAIAEREFRSLNSELDKALESLETSRSNKDIVAIARLEQEVASLELQKKLAQERFDLAIEDRKTTREQRATLRSKIDNDQAALDELTGAASDLESDTEPMSQSEDTEPKHRQSEGTHASRLSGEAPARSQKKDSESDKDAEAEKEEAEPEEEDEELMQASAEAEQKEEEAEEAQEETKSIAARLADIQKLVAQEQKELDLARKKVDLATSTQLSLSQELAKRQSENADQADLNDLRSSIGQASQRLIQARGEVSEISERLNDHRAEQSSLQSEHIVALHEMEKARHEAVLAEERLKALRNPFSPKNMLQWIIDHGPRLLLIVIGMFLLNRMASFFAYRSVRLVTSGSGRGSKVERENRAKTLVGVFQNAATVAIFISGSLMMLEEAGANITVLMGGVAVIGLAVAFGAQNLIKDYFYGFVMLLENQYMLNDTVRIGGVQGQVERITLRMTVLRDANGVVHFIPNGTINSVSNETHGWSRAVCDIVVSRREDLDKVMEALRDVANELRTDSKLGPLIIDAPSEPAIETLGESTVQIKMSTKTLPNRHGTVKQEWLRRIKNRLDAEDYSSVADRQTLTIKKVG